MVNRKVNQGPTDVYGFFTKQGHPLYVGITVDLQRRIRSHMGRDFMKLAERLEYFTCDTREDAQRVERDLIAELRPIFNRACNRWVSDRAHSAWEDYAGTGFSRPNALSISCVREVLGYQDQSRNERGQ